MKKTDHEELLVKHEVIKEELEKLKCVEIRLEEISQDNIKLTELKLDLDAKIERYALHCIDYMFSVLPHLTISFHFWFLNYSHLSISLCIVVTFFCWQGLTICRNLPFIFLKFLGFTKKLEAQILWSIHSSSVEDISVKLFSYLWVEHVHQCILLTLVLIIPQLRYYSTILY